MKHMYHFGTILARTKNSRNLLLHNELITTPPCGTLDAFDSVVSLGGV